MCLLPLTLPLKTYIVLPTYPLTYRYRYIILCYPVIFLLTSFVFLNMGQSRPLFRLFCPFHITIQLQIEKSVDGVLGIWTRGRRMVGADETTELWRPPDIFCFIIVMCIGRSTTNLLQSHLSLRGATIVQWICLHLPSCRPKYTIYAFINLYWFVSCGKDKNKQKEAGLAHFLKVILN